MRMLIPCPVKVETAGNRLRVGTQAFRNPSELGFVTRDTAVATQHALTDPATMVDAARPILGAWCEASTH
jgi:hypothetical protein